MTKPVQPGADAVRFGDYRFERDTGRLWCGDQELRLTPKAAAVLSLLVEHAGTPVSKDALFASVWNGVAVTDDALTATIQEVRRALGDDAREPRFIETRHRRGYRFIAPLSRSPVGSPNTASPAPPAISALAVLPFLDISPGRDQDYLCEGLAEEVINALTQIEGLRVVARSTSFQFRATGGDVREIGRHLRISTLLDGSVRKDGERLRVTVQLVDVSTGYQHWSQRFDRHLDDVFAIQDDIAESVATRVRRGLITSEEKQRIVRPQTSAAAYEYYFRGRQHLPRMTRPDLERSAALFQQAIDVDSRYGPAFAGLAMVHATLYEWFGASDEDLARAERASQRALQTAPGLAEARVSRGCALALSRRYDEASHCFEQAIALNPQLFDAYYYFARAAFASGKIEQSADLFRKASDVNQDDFQSPCLLRQSLQMLGRSEDAAVAAHEGIRRAERILTLNPIDARALSIGSVALYADGQRMRAFEWSERSLELYPDDTSVLVNAACLRARSGDKERALELLERIFGRGWGKRDWVEHDPDYDNLRDDPRFKRLFHRLK